MHPASETHTMTSGWSRRQFLVGCARAGVAFGFAPLATQQTGLRQIQWDDLSPIRDRVAGLGLTPAGFAAHIHRIHEENLRRVREGDLDHLVFYLLQSTQFTDLPAIEPALSAKALVENLGMRERSTFLETSAAPLSSIPAPVRSRTTALIRALDSSATDPRLVYFRGLVRTTFQDRRQREAGLLREYLRAMRFVYEKEFVAQRSERAPEAVAELYRTRGLSTDTAVEAGYLVYVGLGVIKSLEPERRLRRVLIVGPGLDLAPRTALLEDGPPESYQPWEVIDALLALGLSRPGDVEVVGADINPRVVDHLRAARARPPTLTLVSGIQETNGVSFSQDYRQYFAALGRFVGEEETGRPDLKDGHLRKTVRVRPEIARALQAETLDAVTERLVGPPFDLVIATNILPYFDELQLTLAMSNVAGMLAPGGAFLHNEARPSMRDLTSALGLPVEQSRQAVIATVRGSPGPLVDSVWMHRKARR